MSTALDLKNKANELFQQKRFAQAIEVYGQALEAPDCSPDLRVILLCNRAFAYLRVESYGAAIQDATNVSILWLASLSLCTRIMYERLCYPPFMFLCFFFLVDRVGTHTKISFNENICTVL
jgi:tetratricopeptide (TPR) repeat protein